jgi:hypothetical protein
LLRVALQNTENAQVGTYKLLVLYFKTPLPASEVPSALTPTYDAVMHKVRNHRATVYWSKPDAAPQGIADFGFHSLNGTPQPVLLQIP